MCLVWNIKVCTFILRSTYGEEENNWKLGGRKATVLAINVERGQLLHSICIAAVAITEKGGPTGFVHTSNYLQYTELRSPYTQGASDAYFAILIHDVSLPELIESLKLGNGLDFCSADS